MFQLLPDIDWKLILALDRLGIRKRMFVDLKSIMYKGLIDFVGKDRLVDDECTQPLAVFAANGPAPGSTLSFLSCEAIMLLKRVSDGTSTIMKFQFELGGNEKSNRTCNYLEHATYEKRPVFCDTPHFMKYIRYSLNGGDLNVLIILFKKMQ